MSGYAGQLTSRKKRQEKSISKGYARTFSKESEGRAAGLVVLIVGQAQKNGLSKFWPETSKKEEIFL